jgi:hypothetical protein
MSAVPYLQRGFFDGLYYTDFISAWVYHPSPAPSTVAVAENKAKGEVVYHGFQGRGCDFDGGDSRHTHNCSNPCECASARSWQFRLFAPSVYHNGETMLF